MKGKMKALWKMRKEPGAEMGEAEIPPVGPRDVLVEVKAASICGTDLHIYEWDRWAKGRIKPPLIFGHEMSGEVVEKGEEVTSFEIGDSVSAETHIVCGNCLQCRTGNAHICKNVKILGVDTQGVFADYVSIPAQNVWKNDKKIPHWIACAQEPLGNAVHTVFDGEIAGQNVAVFGCGPIGLCSIMLCKGAGAAHVFGIDRVEHRLEMARSVGVDTALNATEDDVVKEITDATDGEGVDVFLEVSGDPLSFKQGFKVLRPGGRASLLGIPSERISLDIADDIVFKGARISGICGRRMFDTWYKTRAMLSSGIVDLSKIITHKFRMDEYEKAFETMKKRKCGKIVLLPK
jgi:threonine 3-dehydrogenase